MMPTPYDRVKRSVFDTEGSLDYIFERNRLWASQQDPEMFERLSKAQSPKFLYFGCSDSRVPAQDMLGLGNGELFVHRNVANLCMNTDYSLLAVLAYAVEVLEVTDIIVCGHYGCGGVKAAMENKDHGLLAHYLHNIRNVQRLHQDELRQIEDFDMRHQRLVELNVQEACMNLLSNPIVQKKQATDAQPRIHGWVYDIGTGLLKDVKADFKGEVRKYKDIYRMYEFPQDGSYHLGEDEEEEDDMDNEMVADVNGWTPPPPIIYNSPSMVPRQTESRQAVGVNGKAKKTKRYGSNQPYKLGL